MIEPFVYYRQRVVTVNHADRSSAPILCSRRMYAPLMVAY